MLGSAAGGGLPQWNCRCRNCELARNGRIPAQLQSSIAVSGDAKSWWLINASPDLALQVENFSPLQPRAAHRGGPEHNVDDWVVKEPNDGSVRLDLRNSPIAGVLLTNADIDHTLGVLLMRQRDQPVPVYTSDEIRGALSWLDQLMQPFSGMEWRHLPLQFVRLMDGIEFRGYHLPRSVAFQLRSPEQRRLVVAPAVSAITGELFDAMKSADAIFFDGTFWSNDELRSVRRNGRLALEMGHMPIEKSLPVLSELTAARKIYLHINNTNPVLDPESRERRIMEAAGVMAAYDGLQFKL